MTTMTARICFKNKKNTIDIQQVSVINIHSNQDKFELHNSYVTRGLNNGDFGSVKRNSTLIGNCFMGTSYYLINYLIKFITVIINLNVL